MRTRDDVHPVLTLDQPWASLLIEKWRCICAGDSPPNEDCPGAQPLKTIETRSWRPPQGLIGRRMWVHASARRPNLTQLRDDLVVTQDDGRWRLTHTPSGQWIDLPLGSLLGHVSVDNALVMRAPAYVGNEDRLIVTTNALVAIERRIGFSRDVSPQRSFGWYEPGRWGWMLSDPVALIEPIAARGRQRVWYTDTPIPIM